MTGWHDTHDRYADGCLVDPPSEDAAPLRKALALLNDALFVQRFPCRHKGIGMPGCVICDPRVYPGALAEGK